MAAHADGCLRGLRGDDRDHAAQTQKSGGEGAAEFRYGVVFVLMLTLVVFVISAPSANWSRAVALAIESAALVVAIATAREPDEARYRKALVVGVVLIIIVATGTASLRFPTAVAALVTVAVPASIIRGSLRLLRERGVTLEAVAAGLAIYLALGLVFAWRGLAVIEMLTGQLYLVTIIGHLIGNYISRRMKTT